MMNEKQLKQLRSAGWFAALLVVLIVAVILTIYTAHNAADVGNVTMNASEVFTNLTAN